MINKKFLLALTLSILFMSALHVNAAEQVRLAVMPFSSKTNELTWEQTSFITDMIISVLNASPLISVFERERLGVIAMEHGFNTNSINQASAIKIGQLAACKYILLGSVTQITQRYLDSRKASHFLLDTYYDLDNRTQEASVHLEARLIDTTTGQVILSFSKSGSAIISDKGEKSHSSSKLVTRAIQAAISRLCDNIREMLTNESAAIISISKNNIRINRGSASGVNIGSLYKVYQDGQEIFDLNGKSLGRKVINLAILRVVNVNNAFSSVEILAGNDRRTLQQNGKKTPKPSKSKSSRNAPLKTAPILIREGDKIEAISFSEAEKINLSSQRI